MSANGFYQRTVLTDFDVKVRANGSCLRYYGTGEGDAERGVVNVNVSTEDEIPDGFQTGALSFTLITGQADICMKGPVRNPFQLSLGAYRARRVLKIPGHGRLMARYVVNPPEGNRRTASFDISGNVHLPELVSIEPSVEIWRPRSSTRVNGEFRMVWNAKNGEQIIGLTQTAYEFPQPIPEPELLSRSIIFELRTEGQELFQSEIIRLYRGVEAGRTCSADLALATS